MTQRTDRRNAEPHEAVQIFGGVGYLLESAVGRSSCDTSVRTQYGAGTSSGSQHSQSLEALLAHIPRLKAVMPSTPADAYGQLRAAQRCLERS